MANLSNVFGGTGFNAATVDPTSKFEPIPKGKYPVIVSESDVKPTRDHTGDYLQLTLEVIDGRYKGRKLWTRLNIRNRSKEAEDIAHRTLSALCHASGVMNLTSSEQLHNIPVIADVKIDKSGEQNDVVTFAAINANAPKAGGFQPPKSQTPAAMNAGESSTVTGSATTATSHSSAVPPWKRSQ